MLLKKIGLIFFSSVITSPLFAQQNTVSTGGTATGTGGEVTYTVGQIDYSSYSAGASINEGVQQPYEFYLIVGIEELDDLTVNIFPNPSSDYITISIHSALPHLACRLIDSKGKIILESALEEKESTLNIEQLAQGNYHLEILQNDKHLNTYKLIKH